MADNPCTGGWPSLTANPQPAPHILVVDDEPHFCAFLRLALQEAGYVVHSAEDGQAALHIFQTAPIDLVLTDLHMPVMDGYTLCAQLRSGSDVPIIMLSATGESVDLLLGFQVGVDAYIAKPFQWHEVEERIQQLLRRSRSRPH